MLFRYLNVVPKLFFRNYSKQIKEMSFGGKSVYQEIMRYVTPYSRINIRSELPVRIRPADIHTYPNGDAFVAELHGDMVKNSTATMNVEISEDEKEVNVELRKLDPKTRFHCEMALPIKAEIIVNSLESVNIRNIQSENVCINAGKDINGKDIRAENINLCSSGGSIRIKGLLLGRNISMKTVSPKGSIDLDKLQGDDLFCKTSDGKIVIQSCYVLQSKFETDSGDLQLNNIHRNSVIKVNDKSNINMTGIHGNVVLNSNGGSLVLQFSELEGESIINAKSLNQAIINISDKIEQNAYFLFKCSAGINLKENMEPKYLSEDLKMFKNFENPSKEERIFVNLDCSQPLDLGKKSWSDLLKLKYLS